LGGAGATTATGLSEKWRCAVSDGGLHRKEATEPARNPVPFRNRPLVGRAATDSEFRARTIAKRGGATLRRNNTPARLAICNGAPRRAACACISHQQLYVQPLHNPNRQNPKSRRQRATQSLKREIGLQECSRTHSLLWSALYGTLGSAGTQADFCGQDSDPTYIRNRMRAAAFCPTGVSGSPLNVDEASVDWATGAKSRMDSRPRVHSFSQEILLRPCHYRSQIFAQLIAHVCQVSQD
jgi:hypothetical protein